MWYELTKVLVLKRLINIIILILYNIVPAFDIASISKLIPGMQIIIEIKL